jgi:hypothetical protein
MMRMVLRSVAGLSIAAVLVAVRSEAGPARLSVAETAPMTGAGTLLLGKDKIGGKVQLSWGSGTAPYAVTRTSNSTGSGTPALVTSVAVTSFADPVLNDGLNESWIIDPGPFVHLNATVSDPNGLPLTYAWKTTDGVLLNVNGPDADWLLPAGRGLHFAYLLASNGKGGYTERRVAVNTDTIGTPFRPTPPLSPTAPAAPARIDNPFQSVIRGNGYYTSPVSSESSSNGIYVPDAEVCLGSAPNCITASAFTDERGYFTIPHVPDGTYDLLCPAFAGGLCSDPGSPIVINGQAASDPYGGPQDGRGGLIGRLLLSDGAPCGTVNQFFGKAVVGSASLLNGGGTTVEGPYRANEFGHYGFTLSDPSAVSIDLHCEGAAATVPVPLDPSTTSPRTLLANTAAPGITAMSAKLNGTEVGLFLPPPTGLASDNVAGAEFFLTFKGIDTRLGACRYYQAVGAATSCDVNGNPTGSMSFDDWKRAVKMVPYALPGTPEYTATYINKVDLNLTRVHHSISYGQGQTAAYVCNHLGPADDTQAAADTAITTPSTARTSWPAWRWTTGSPRA